MNKFKLISIVISIFLITYLGFNYSWLTIASYEDMRWNAEQVEKNSYLPSNILQVFDSLYPKKRYYSMNEDMFYRVYREMKSKGDVKINCRCDDLAYLAIHHDSFSFKYNVNVKYIAAKAFRFGYGIEYFIKPEYCFNFWLKHDIMFRGRYISLNEYSHLLYQKPLAELDKDQVINLINRRINRKSSRFL